MPWHNLHFKSKSGRAGGGLLCVESHTHDCHTGDQSTCPVCFGVGGDNAKGYLYHPDKTFLQYVTSWDENMLVPTVKQYKSY